MLSFNGMVQHHSPTTSTAAMRVSNYIGYCPFNPRFSVKHLTLPLHILKLSLVINPLTMLSLMLVIVCLSIIQSGKAMSMQTSNRIAVAGATGKVGSLVITELLNQEGTFVVRALVRDLAKAKKTLPPPSERLEIIECDLGTKSDISRACKDSDALIWCATGFSENSSPLNKLFALFKIKLAPKESIDVAALSQIGEIFKKKITEDSNTPQVPSKDAAPLSSQF